MLEISRTSRRYHGGPPKPHCHLIAQMPMTKPVVVPKTASEKSSLSRTCHLSKVDQRLLPARSRIHQQTRMLAMLQTRLCCERQRKWVMSLLWILTQLLHLLVRAPATSTRRRLSGISPATRMVCSARRTLPLDYHISKVAKLQILCWHDMQAFKNLARTISTSPVHSFIQPRLVVTLAQSKKYLDLTALERA